MSATPPTPPLLTVTRCPRALNSACTVSGMVLATDKLPCLSRVLFPDPGRKKFAHLAHRKRWPCAPTPA